MDAGELMLLGLNRNEAVVYLSLLKFGQADAGDIIKDTKFHKNIVYDNMEKLINRGLVTTVVEENRKVFQAAPASALVDMVELRERELAEQKTLAKRLSEQARRLRRSTRMHDAVVYRGVNGVRAFYSDIIPEGDYVVFGGPRESLAIMGEHYWLNLNAKLAERGISVKMIFNPSLREYGESIQSKRLTVRYFVGNFEPLTETQVGRHHVAIIVWTEEPIVCLIRSEVVAASYRKFFEEMWKKARK